MEHKVWGLKFQETRARFHYAFSWIKIKCYHSDVAITFFQMFSFKGYCDRPVDYWTRIFAKRGRKKLEWLVSLSLFHRFTILMLKNGKEREVKIFDPLCSGWFLVPLLWLILYGSMKEVINIDPKHVGTYMFDTQCSADRII